MKERYSQVTGHLSIRKMIWKKNNVQTRTPAEQTNEFVATAKQQLTIIRQQIQQ